MAVAVSADRAWFEEEGWMLPDDQLKTELVARGVDEETVSQWRDEAADRRAEAAKQPSPLNYTPAEHVLGALLMAGALGADITAATLERVAATGLTAGMFERDRDRVIYQAIGAIVARREPAEWLLVEQELTVHRNLAKAGGPNYVRELAKMAPAIENAPHYAALVVEIARRRDMERLGLRVTEAARNGGVDQALLDELVRAAEPGTGTGPPPEAVDAGSFVFDEPTDPAAIRLWGDDTQIGWAAGEGFMLVGPDGVGKTTLGQQLALARCGLRDQVLGMTVASAGQRVLYIAADRPRQAARSMRRMVGDLDRQLLEERMTVWRGPLPAMLNEDRSILARLAKQFDAGTIVVDSLKDVAVDVATDEAGGRIAAAFQHLIATGVELLVMHHPRKPGLEQHRRPRELADVYGSRLIFGAFGSVVMLWGDPGDAIVELRHLKQPVDEIGPWNIRHDHVAGRTTVETGTDLVQLVLNASTAGLTATAAAGLVYEKETPTKNEVERTRAKLDRLCSNGRLVKMPGRRGSAAGSNAGGAAEQAVYLFNGPAEAFQ